MISIQRHVAEKLVLHFRGWPQQYGFETDETGAAVTLYHMPFRVSGGYVQIFGPVIMVIPMSELLSIAFIPADGLEMEGPLIDVE